MPQAEARSRFWRRVRIHFRRLRITVLLAMLALLGVFIYLNLHGLPDFAKRPLLEKLRARGLDLEFSRVRLRTYRGLVAEDVRFGTIREPGAPRLSAAEVEISLVPSALLRLQLQVDALKVRAGRLELPVLETNSAPRALTVENIEGQLLLLPGDAWTLEALSARFAGARFFLSGTLTNASAVRNWKFSRDETGQRPPQWPERLRRIADTLEKISFTSTPELRLMVDGDAKNVSGITARFTFIARGADTPWGQATNVAIAARLFPGAGGELSHLEMSLRAAEARTPWADTAGLNLNLNLDSTPGATNLVDGTVTAHAIRAVTPWAAVTNAELTGQWIHSLTNAIPLSGLVELRAANTGTRWAKGAGIRFAAAFATLTNPPVADASWAVWTNLLPYQLDWECEIAGVESEKLVAGKISGGGLWRAPTLVITNLHAELYNGALDANAALNIATREAWFGLVSDFDPAKISPLLTPKAQQWLARFSWVNTPHVRGGGAITLPAWTNDAPDWRAEVQPTLRLAGEFAVTNGTYLGIAADWARSHLSYTNQVWWLPDLEAGRAEGQLRLEHIADDKTHDYYFRVHSTVDVRAVRPQLSPEAQRGFDLFQPTQSPVIDAELWGRWREHERIGFRGSVAVTNFSFREQTVDNFVSDLRYTNQVLELLEPRLWRGTQFVSAAGVAADFNSQRIHITNGFSTAEPMVIGRAIGPKTAKHLEPYIFKSPPTAHVNGYAPMKDERDADLRFTIEGGPFEWLMFKVPRIAGNAHWRGETLSLTNVTADFYAGQATGDAGFNFSRDIPGTDFHFAVDATNVNLRFLMADLSSRSNRLEGLLDGRLAITSANSENFHSWNGGGRARLRDGLIWEIPIFGVLSKPLDSVVSGLGSSTMSEATAQYSVRNGVIYSDDLEMRATTMRLQYDGSVDFDGRVAARVRAQPLRDVWIFGPVVNTVLWPVTKILEYKVTGTLGEPKTEPVYIPKILLVPLHPIQSLENLFSTDPGKTNAPPVFREP